ncbi:MAG TPA: Ppx/GppA phosphatase family protein [Streptosporangiaceae bacterium]
MSRVAAIDCGTNSLRMLIADVTPAQGRLTDVLRRMEVVRLGEGVDATGKLAPEAVGRTLGMLAEYAQQVRQSGATAVRMVATSASRDAANAAEFTGGVTDILGVPPEVITGTQEARLTFDGATAELTAGTGGATGATGVAAGYPPPFLVVDIGGGSTEFVVGPGVDPAAPGDGPEPAAISVDIGCVRLTERHLHSDPPTPAQIEAATADIDAALARVTAAVPATSARTLLGLAGSVATIAAIALGLPAYDSARIHHTRVPSGQVTEITRMLLRQTRRERAAIGPMHPGRADVIGGGALILDRLLDRLGFAEVVQSEHDILDGIAWQLAVGPR